MSSLKEFVVGPMPVNVFLETFMKPSPTASRTRMRKAPKRLFQNIILRKSKGMRKELASAINENGHCPGYVLRSIPQHSERASPSTLCVYTDDGHGDSDVPSTWHKLQFFANISTDDTHDPFIDLFKDPNRDYDLRGKDSEIKVDSERMFECLLKDLNLLVQYLYYS
ncbi:hypothetical protein K474DRAFT_1710555 [Panus rudis PR-1116 ss-1]|nr:hypothetical protein K474DRAFT_1710555 [Panus rudis PR-1116 ss-1]